MWRRQNKPVCLEEYLKTNFVFWRRGIWRSQTSSQQNKSPNELDCHSGLLWAKVCVSYILLRDTCDNLYVLRDFRKFNLDLLKWSVNLVVIISHNFLSNIYVLLTSSQRTVHHWTPAPTRAVRSWVNRGFNLGVIFIFIWFHIIRGQEERIRSF